MNCGRRKRQICTMLMGILFCCVGCGLQQEKQDMDASEVTTGAALYVAEDYQSESVQHQLDLLVENAHKWRIAGDEAGDEEFEKKIKYAVTDLDRNGRLEIMVLREDEYEDQYLLQGFFEVNVSGDGVKEIETNQIGDISMDDDGLMELEMAYYDSKTGECHYVIENELSKEEQLSDESSDYGKSIIALTLKQGKLSSDMLANQTQIKTQTGKMQSRFYQVNDTGRIEINPSEYTVEELGDAVYANCGKCTVRFSNFIFDHSLKDMTEKQMHYALERSYRESFMGYPLGQKDKKVAGHKIQVPQYSTMQDAEKQKRINQMIVKQVEQILNQLDSKKDAQNVDISVKYAGCDRVSLLVQGSGICDTINIDLEQGSLLLEQELLPESVREVMVEEVELDLDDSEEYADIYENLVDHLERWQGISLYQTSNMIGFVIPTDLASEPYVIHEVWSDTTEDSYYCGGVSFAEIDWEAYQYKMFATEYQALQDYMPVLTGGAEFIMENDEEAEKSEKMTIISWAEENFDEKSPETLPVYEVCICDLTQDGKPELILDAFAGMHLILHKEGNTYYGSLEGKRSLYGLQTNGVYSAGKEDRYIYQLHFEKDHFADEYLGRYELHFDEDSEGVYEYYIQDEKVKKDVYEKWEKSIMTEYVYWYSTEALIKDDSRK